MLKDTIRILITRDCNLFCSYCCNKLPEQIERMVYKSLNEIDFSEYENICITGGEPLLNLWRLESILKQLPTDKTIILYTNGYLLDYIALNLLHSYNVKFITVGLHNELEPLISRIKRVYDYYIKTVENPIQFRFNVQDIYKEKNLESIAPEFDFKYWLMNDCTRDNEDVVVLK